MSTFVFTEFPLLETERLRLRQINRDDTAAWLSIFNHPEVIHYLVDFNDFSTDLAEVDEIVGWTEEIFAAQSGLRWAISLKPDPTMIGSCGFHLYTKAHRCAEIGYELHRDYWRQGIMREALRVMLDFGFQQLNLHRIEANVTAGNNASAGLLRNLGFTQEGAWRDKVYARGRFHDLWQFGLLEDEYNRS